jgi:hypothetical protein
MIVAGIQKVVKMSCGASGGAKAQAVCLGYKAFFAGLLQLQAGSDTGNAASGDDHIKVGFRNVPCGRGKVRHLILPQAGIGSVPFHKVFLESTKK